MGSANAGTRRFFYPIVLGADLAEEAGPAIACLAEDVQVPVLHTSEYHMFGPPSAAGVLKREKPRQNKEKLPQDLA